MRVWAFAAVLLLLSGPGSAVLVETLPGTEPPVATAAPQAPPELPRTLEEGIRLYADTVGVDPTGPGASKGLRNAFALTQRQQPGNVTDPEPNGTEAPSLGEGVHSHNHGAVGDQGLSPVWAAPFHGVPSRLVVADVTGDGVEEALVPSDISISAFADDGLLWAVHIGSPVRGVTVVDLGDGPDVWIGTGWDAQTPRIMRIDGSTGHVVWTQVMAAPVVTIGASGDGILYALADNTHGRLDAATGTPQWTVEGALIPNAILVFNAGTYLAEVGDLNGDGVPDVASASLQYIIGVAAFHVFTIVTAFDGTDGERLWTNTFGEAPSGYLSFTIVNDLTLLDARGDGSLDVAATAFGLRYPVLLSPSFIFESTVRVIDGASAALGVPVAQRTLASTGLIVEYLTDIVPTDTNGDGKDEAAILDIGLVSGLLASSSTTLVRYGFDAAAGTMLLLSDVHVPTGSRLHAHDIDGDGRLDQVVTGVDGGLRVVGSTGEVLHDVAGDGLRDMAALGDGFATISLGSFHTRTAPAAVASTFELRGKPWQVERGDVDRDGTPDLFVLSTDGRIHVLDGLTGGVVDTIAQERPIRAVKVSDAANAVNMVIQVDGEMWYDDPTLKGLDGTGLQRWSVAMDRFEMPGWNAAVPLFDGNKDGYADALPRLDDFEGVATAVDGATGAGLWHVEREFDNVREVMVLPRPSGDDLLLRGGESMELVDGATGSRVFAIEGQFYRTRCAAATADGVFLFGDAYENGGVMTHISYSGTLMPTDLGLDAAYLYDCDVMAIGNATSQDVLVHLTYRAEDGMRSGFGRWSPEGWAWRSFGASDEIAFDGRVLGGQVEADVVYVSWQDHIYARSWSTGEPLAQFTVNGPFVEDGVVFDMDLRAPSEVFALTGDGIVWALAQDRADVARYAAIRADELGKEKGESLLGIEPLDGGSKESPMPVFVAPVILAALVRRWSRRR